MALKDKKREDLDALAEKNDLKADDYSNKEDLASALEKKGVDEDESAQAVTETDRPRDPSLAIPEIALSRYLDPAVASQASNPQL